MKEALLSRKPPAIERYMPVIGGVLRLFPNHVSPTAELGKVLVDLALGNGAEMSGKGIEKGRILEPSVLRRLYKESTSVSN